jgi:hypothetical protein
MRLVLALAFAMFIVLLVITCEGHRSPIARRNYWYPHLAQVDSFDQERLEYVVSHQCWLSDTWEGKKIINAHGKEAWLGASWFYECPDGATTELDEATADN